MFFYILLSSKNSFCKQIAFQRYHKKGNAISIRYEKNGWNWSFCTHWRVAYWRAMCPDRMDEPHKPWPSNRQKGIRPEGPVSVQPSLIHQLLHFKYKWVQLASLIIRWVLVHYRRWHDTFSLMSALPGIRRSFWWWVATGI